MVFRRRKLKNQVQTLIDEMLHVLRHESANSGDAYRPRAVQAARLESRVLMSASPMAVVAEAVSPAPADAASSISVMDANLLSNVTDFGLESPAQPESVHAESTPMSDDAIALDTSTEVSGTPVDAMAVLAETSEALQDSGPELIVIDYRVQDADTLLFELLNTDRDFRILRLDADTDGISQITQKLQQVGNVSAVHLLTHGAAGEILLGSTVLNADTLAQHAPELLSWQHSLTANADLLLYGCDVAETTEGQHFVDALAELTAADVEASDDRTGSTSLGGDAILEYRDGVIEASVAFSKTTWDTWNNVLAANVAPVNTVPAGQLISPDTLLVFSTANGNAISISDVDAAAENVEVTLSVDNGSLSLSKTTGLVFSIGDGINDSTIMFQGTLANINAALNGLRYMPSSGWTGVATLNIVTNDLGNTGTGGALTDSECLAIAVHSTVTSGTQTVASSAIDEVNSNAHRGVARSISTAQNGNFVVVYRTATSNGFFTLYSSSGTQLATGQINTAGNLVADVSVAMGDEGDFVVAWSEGIPGSEDIFAQRFTASGVAIGAKITVDASSGAQTVATIDKNAAGDFVIAWESGSTGIRLRRFDSTGTAIDASSVTVASSPNGTNASVGIDHNRYVLVGWDDASGQYLSRFDGTTFSTKDTLSTSTNAGGSAIAINEAGQAVIAWHEQGSDWNVKFLLINADGTRNGTIASAASTTTGDELNPSVAMDESGDFVISWETNANIQMRRFDATGTALGSDENVATAGTLESNASVDMLDNGNVVVLWTDQGTSADLKLRRYGTAVTDSQAPVIDPISNRSITVGGSATVDVFIGDADTDIDSLTLTYSSSNTALLSNTSIVNLGGRFDRQLQMTPTSGQTGSTTVTVTVSDGARSVTTSFILNVVPLVSPIATTGELLVNQTTSNIQSTNAETRGSQRAVSMASDGSYVVVWSSNQSSGTDGDGWGVLMRKFDSHGNPLTAEILVNQVTASDQQWATVSTDAFGNGVVVWTSTAQDNGSSSGVYARRFDASGLFVTNEFSVNTTTNADQGNAVVDMNAYGEFIVAWSGNGTGDADGIFYRRYDTDGTALDATEVRANASNLGAEISPAVAINDSGLFSIAWNVGNDLYQRNFAADGTPTTVDFQVDNGLANAYGAAIGIDAQGRTVTVYRTDGLSGLGAGIWLRAFNANGSQWRTWQMVASGDATAPSIAMDNAGNFNIAYEGSGDGDGKTIYVRRYSSSFSALEAVQQVNVTTAGNQQMASIAMLDQSNYTIVWSGEQGSGDTDGVFARQFGFVNVAPVITSNGGGATAAISVVENNTAVTTVTATDANVPAQTLTYSIAGGADASKFTINTSTGVLAFAAGPNFETRADANADNVYNVIVAATDGLQSTNQTISVTVTNINEAPIAQTDTYAAVLNTTLTVPAGTGLLANDSDPENNTMSIVAVGTPSNGTVSLTPAALAAITNLTNNASADTRADWSPNGQKIAFDTGRDGNNEIYVMNADGSGLVRLTNNSADDSQAAWSPDGTKIAFMSNRSGQYEVWVMNASDGSGLTQLTTTSSSVSGQPVWSPDGTKIAFTSNRSGNYEIYVMNANGSSVTRLTTATGDDSEPAWSPDGTRIAFASTRDGNSEIYVMNANGTGQTRLTSDAAVDRSPVWSPNGSKIAFISARSGVQQIYMMDANGANPTAVTAQSTNVAFPDWSPDGLSMLFTLNNEVQKATVVFDGGFVYTPTVGYVGTDSFTYTVSDLNGLTTTATATININAPPVITSNGGGTSASLSVSENATAVTTVTATDANLPTQTLTYSISGGADAAKFLINTSTGVLTFATAPNFELPTDVGSNNVYDVIVQVSDGSLTDTQAIAVTVTAVNDNTPTITSNGGGLTTSISVVENSTIVTTVTATDADLPTQALTYSISGGADAAKFAINSATGVLRFLVAPNFEAATDVGVNNVYDVTVRVSDGSLVDTQEISVTVTNSTTGDVLLATQDTYVSSSQKSNNYGQSTSLIVDKSGSGIGNGRALLMFDLADIPANVTITSATLIMQATQNSGAIDVNVYQVTQAWSEGSGNGAAGAASWDQRQAGVNWTAAGGDFASTIVATLNTAAIGQHSWNITSLVADWKAGDKANFGIILGSPNTGSGTITYDSAEGAIVPQLLVTYDISNAPPVITSNGGGVSGSVSVAENSSTVTTVTATDANTPGQTLTYSISGGADATSFAINGSTGVLTFVTAPNFESPTDVGANNTYDVTVRVSDGIIADTQAISVTVSNVNEAPVMTVGSVSLGSIAANQTSAAMTVNSFAGASISDPDAGALAGIAVTGSSGTGTWQYSTDGVTWNNVGTVSTTQARLLRSSDSVRFVGNAITAGTASLTYAAWDQTGTTSGQQGSLVSLSTLGTGGSTPFSSTTNTANLSLLTVNQPPVATSDSYSLNEGSTLTTTTASGWFSSAWNSRQRISFNNAAGTALTGQAVLVTLNAANFNYANAKSAGEDLRFVDGDGTLLSYEIEQWNVGGTSQVWVRVPQIDAASNTDFIWLYSGNSQAADAQNSGAVWVNQEAVLHMNGIPKDSSANAISVTTSGTTSISGVLTAARDFDGVDDFIKLGSSAEVDNLFASGGTISAWINPDGWGEAGYGRIADKAATVLANAGGEAGWGLQVTSGGAILFDHGFSSTQGEWKTNDGVISLSGGWYQVTLIYNASTPTIDPRIYINGVQVAMIETLTPSGTILDDSAVQFTVGNHAAATTRTFDGAIDELRAAKTSLTAAQALADYRTVAGTLASIGSSEAGPGGVLNNDTDPESSPLTVSLVSGPAHATSFTLNPDGSFTYVHDGSETTGDSFTYRISDGTSSDTATVSLTITPINDSLPVISPGASFNVSENAPTGTALGTLTATDGDAGSTFSNWRITGGNNAGIFAIDSSTGAMSIANPAALDYEAATTHTLTVTVFDGINTSLPQTVNITVLPVNDNIPVITSNGGGATASISVAENATAVTTVTAADADLPSQTHTYSISGGVDAAKFSINSSTGALRFVNAPDYEAPTDNGANNVYDVIVRVSDGTFADTQAIAVTVTPVNDNTPVITSNGAGSNASISIAENSTSVTTVTATDADLPAQTLTFSISGGSDASKFVINSTTGVLSFATAPDCETPTDSGTNNVYNVTVQVSDGTRTDTQSIAVTVTPVNDNTPVITFGGGGTTATVTVLENVTAVATLTTTDADLPSQSLVYSITGGADAAKFVIESATGALRFVTASDFEVPTDANLDNVYDVVVTVSDGAFSDTQTLAVTVAPANDNDPVITSGGGGSNVAISVAENSTAVTTVTATDADLPSQALTYSISGGADRTRFVIDSVTGVLSFATAPDYESPVDSGANNVYRVTVQVSDGTLVDTQDIAVTVTPLNDNAPIITSNGGAATALVNVAENTTAVTTVIATDADRPNQTLVYSIVGGVDAAMFSINSSTGELVFRTAPNYELPTDTGTDNVYDVVVQVTDGTFLETQSIAVTVTPVNERDPVITSNGGGATAAISVSENGTAVTIVTATDADLPSPTLVYSISGGSDAAKFVINSSTGELTFASAPNFEVPVDSNLNNIYSVTVRVSDGSRVDNQTIFVTVTNVNEAPIITSNGGAAVALINMAENTTMVTTVTSTDVDGASPVYSIVGGADSALFTIDSVTGVLRFVNSQDFDTPNDANGDNIFVVGVQVSDGNGATDFQLVNVHLTNVNETPVGTPINPVLVLEDAPASTVSVAAAYSDPDREALTFSITAVNAPTPLFRSLTINAATGIITYDLRANANGAAVINVQARDAGGLLVVQQLSFNVQSVNDAPQAVNFTSSTIVGQTLSISSPGLLQGATDIDSNSLQAVLVQAPAHGSIVLQPNGSFVYTPDSGYTGNDTFLFATSDGLLRSATQTATISVLPPVVNVPGGSGLNGGSTGSSSSTGSSTTSGSSTTGSGTSGSGTGSTATTTTNATTNTNSAGGNAAGTTSGSGQVVATSVVPLNGLGGTQGATTRQDDDLGIIITAPAVNTETRIRTVVPSQAPAPSSSAEIGDRIQTRRTLIGAIGFSDRAVNLDSAQQAAARAQFLQREVVYQTLIQQNLENVESLEEKLSERFSISDQVVGSVGVVTTSFSVGYLIWAVRFGTLLSGLLTQIPTWSMLDPLLVIDGATKEEDKESLQSIMDRQQAQIKTNVSPQQSPDLSMKTISDHSVG